MCDCAYSAWSIAKHHSAPHANLGKALYILEKWKQLCENTCVFSFLLAAFLTTFIPLVHLLFLSLNKPLSPPKLPTIIPASPPLPYKWVEANLSLLCGCVLHQVRPLLKQLRWTRFLCCFWKPCQAFFLFYFDCIERLHYHPPSPQNHPPTPTHTTQSSSMHWGVWSFRVCFCCGVSVSRLMQGKGSCVPILEKSWYRGESSPGQPLRITLPCLMYMKQNSCSSC